jgi:hypothetical protein
MAEILHWPGSSSLMVLPTAADLNGPLANAIKTYLETDTASAVDRMRFTLSGIRIVAVWHPAGAL